MVTRRAVSATLVSAVTIAAVLVGLIGPAAPAAANHDTVDWSRYYDTTFSPRSELYPSTFVDDQGHLYLLYYDVNPSNGDTNLTMDRYRMSPFNGLPLWEMRRAVNPTAPNVVRVTNIVGYPRPPSVAQDHDGNLYVAWADMSYNVYVTKSTDRGDTWGAPSRVDTTAAESFDTGPVIVATPSAVLYVVWQRVWLPGGYWNLTAATSVDRAGTWTARTNITLYGSDLPWSHEIAIDSLGRAHVAYWVVGAESHANYTRTDDGSTWASPVQLDGGAQAAFPTISVDSADRVHIAWYDSRVSTSGVSTFWYRRSDDRGSSWSLELPITQGRFFVGGGSFGHIITYGTTVLFGFSAYDGVTNSFAYVTSSDGGNLWDPEKFVRGDLLFNPRFALDANGTLYASVYRWNEFFASWDVGYLIWDGPPSAPTITNIARGPSDLTVAWTPSPEADVIAYRVWRSTDGITYELLATVDDLTTSYADTGLANGTYWYRVTALDGRGTSSHSSAPISGTVGQTVEEMIDDLEAQIDATMAEIAQLQADVGNAQVDIDDLQSRLAQLQTDLDVLQSDVDANDAATQQRLNDLENQLDSLQNQLNQMRTEVATQTMSYVNMLLVVVVLALVAYLLVQQMRMRKMPPNRTSARPPPSPPSQSSAPKAPEDEL